jgi:tetratricopeptide (TPR) repeat protein
VAVLAFCLHSLVDFDWYAPAIGLTVFGIMALPVHPREPADAAPASRPSWAFIALLVVAVGLPAAWGIRETAAGVHLSSGRRAVAAGHVREAEGELRQAAALSPLDPGPYRELGLLYEGAFRATGSAAVWQQAFGSFRQESTLAPSATACAHVAGLYEAIGDFAAAARWQQQAAALAPRDPYVIAGLGRLYQAAGQDRLAEQAYQRLSDLYDSPVGQIEAFEGTTDFRYAYAWLYFANKAHAGNDAQEAQAWLGRADSLLQRYEAAIAKRRLLYETQGQWPPSGLIEAQRLHEQVRTTRAAWEGEAS